MELKSSAFKHFVEQNLFQIACSDACERFEIMMVVFLTGLMTYDGRDNILYLFVYVLVAEIAVDWV